MGLFDLKVYHGGNVVDGAADGKSINGANVEGVEAGLGTMGSSTGLGSDEDSDDEEFVPSKGDIDSVDDVHFTNSENDYDDDGCFDEEQNREKDLSRNEKGKGVVNEGFSGEDGCESDELDDVYQAGVGHAEAGEGEEDDFGVESGVFPVYKAQKVMKDYRWQFGTVFANRDEFKDAIVSYAVQNARGVWFKKYDLKRVRACCVDGCPFWLYAAKMQGESTW
ncbi:hypothetical protein PIB30_002945 [Stylosanthes scabra]|uniref:Transposase MuDR plant domain-containing protein n=1 Tax=Stylosanthes scabra TaxID=79078 RepID=A0ABU6V691_9FABA|nr:hypothetical protein [Stylosanthes scabra]